MAPLTCGSEILNECCHGIVSAAVDGSGQSSMVVYDFNCAVPEVDQPKFLTNSIICPIGILSCTAYLTFCHLTFSLF